MSAASLYWSRKLSRRERVRQFFSWPYIRQTRFICPLVEWWWNRG